MDLKTNLSENKRARLYCARLFFYTEYTSIETTLFLIYNKICKVLSEVLSEYKNNTEGSVRTNQAFVYIWSD